MATVQNQPQTKKRYPYLRYIPCRVEPGMFRDEFLVFIEAIDPSAPNQIIPVQLLVGPGELKNVEGTPARGKPVNGWLLVSLAGAERGFAQVVLPQPGIPVGETMLVRQEVMRKDVA